MAGPTYEGLWDKERRDGERPELDSIIEEVHSCKPDGRRPRNGAPGRARSEEREIERGRRTSTRRKTAIKL